MNSQLIDSLLAELGISKKNEAKRAAIISFAGAIAFDALHTGKRWLIWNHERGQWWKRNCRGYTMDLNEAGRFSFCEANGLVNEGNLVRLNAKEKPQDSMMEETT